MSCNVFYPDELLAQPKDEPKVVVGHRDSVGNYVVVAVVPKDSAYLPKARLGSVINIDDKMKLSVIGYLNEEHESGLTIFIEDGCPIVRNGGTFVNVILFKTPNSLQMEFYSLNSMLIRRLKPDEFKDKLDYHLTTPFGKSAKSEHFEHMLYLINSMDYLRYKFFQSDPKVSQTGGNKHFGSKILLLISFMFVFMINSISSVLNFKIFRQYSMTSVSNFFYQLDTRLILFTKFPEQIKKVKQKTASLQLKPTLPNYLASREYIRFYNLVYVILIDLILGSLLRNYISDRIDTVGEFLKYVTNSLLFTELDRLIRWLMDNPAGFKLNSELSTFVGELNIWALQFWYRQIMNKLQNWNLQILLIMVLKLSKIFGATLIIAGLCDVVKFLQIHIACFSLSMARVFNWQLNVLKSLFRLFYGNKYNVLRKRIDRQQYDFDQLLLGIIIFTVLVYLLPTIAAFYITFVVLNLGFYLVSLTLQSIIFALNQLPIFIILLSLKNPKRLSDGLTLKMTGASNDQIVIRMSSRSLSLFKLLGYYWQLMNLNQQFLSFRQILVSVLTGERIPHVDFHDIYENFKNI